MLCLVACALEECARGQFFHTVCCPYSDGGEDVDEHVDRDDDTCGGDGDGEVEDDDESLADLLTTEHPPQASAVLGIS